MLISLASLLPFHGNRRRQWQSSVRFSLQRVLFLRLHVLWNDTRAMVVDRSGWSKEWAKSAANIDRGSVARHTLITYPLPGQYREEVDGERCLMAHAPASNGFERRFDSALLRNLAGGGKNRLTSDLQTNILCISHLSPTNSQQRAERLLSSLLDATPVRRPSSSRPSRMVMTTSASPTASLPVSPEDLARSPAACPRRRLRSDPER